MAIRKPGMEFGNPPKVNVVKGNGKGDDTTDAEMRALERDLGRLDDNDLAIKDDFKTTIDALLSILQGDARVGTLGLDEQRAQLRQRISIAVELKERDEAKNLKEAYQKVLKRMHVALRRLVAALAQEEAQGLRENVANWLHIRANLRIVMVKALQTQHGIDLSGIVAQAVEKEEEAKAAMIARAREMDEAEILAEEAVPV